MPRLALVAVLLAAPVLAACVAEPPPAPVDPGLDACGATALQGLIGQPRTVLQTMRFGGPTRIIEPGMAVTMDYSAERLNIWIAEGGLIEQVTCG